MSFTLIIILFHCQISKVKGNFTEAGKGRLTKIVFEVKKHLSLWVGQDSADESQTKSRAADKVS